MSNSSIPKFPVHGDRSLPTVSIDSYSLALEDKERDGFVGDRASRTAFTRILHVWRKQFRDMHRGEDALGKGPTKKIRKRVDDLLQAGGDAADIVEAAVEDFAHQLAHVAEVFMKQRRWEGVERIIVGGGFQQTETGKLAVARAAQILKIAGVPVDLRLLHYHPDEGGLVGWVHVLPKDALPHVKAFLAVDIGGTNVRCGIVRTNFDEASDLRNAEVVLRQKWGHASDKDVTRRANLIGGIAEMLDSLAQYAGRMGIDLDPMIGVACPGMIHRNGAIAAGTQNLPGDWEAPNFKLATALAEKIPSIQGKKVRVLLHNDAVIQGLSQRPFTQGVRRWGVFTLGTGLGNASYTNRGGSGS